MNTIILDAFSDFAKGMSFTLPTEPTIQVANSLSNPLMLVAAVILIAVTIFLFFFLKNIIMNTILGGLLWAISTFVFNVQLPFIPSLVIALIFGPAGIGAMLILKFFGLLA